MPREAVRVYVAPVLRCLRRAVTHAECGPPPPSLRAPVEVELIRNKGCMWAATAVLSLGLAPLVVGRYYRQAPRRLTEEEMTLQNGQRLPWSAFTRVTATDIYLGSGLSKRYMKTRYVLQHSKGKVDVQTDTLRDADRVIAFILDHVPPQARAA